MRARVLMKFLRESVQFFPVLSNTVPALFISFDLKCPVRFSLKMSIFVVPFSVAYVNIPSIIKNYTSKGASRLFYITLRERLVPNIVLLNDVFLIEQWRLILSKFQNMNIQCYFTQKLQGFRLGNKKN